MTKRGFFELLQTSNSMQVSMSFFATLGINYATIADLNDHIEEELAILYPLFCDSFKFIKIQGRAQHHDNFMLEFLAHEIGNLPPIYGPKLYYVEQLQDHYKDFADIPTTDEMILRWKTDNTIKSRFKELVYNTLKQIIIDPQTIWSDMAMHVICCQIPHQTSDYGLYDPRGTYIMIGMRDSEENGNQYSNFEGDLDAVAMNAFRDIFLSDSNSFEWRVLILTRLANSLTYRNSRGKLISGELNEHTLSCYENEQQKTTYYLVSHRPRLLADETLIITEIEQAIHGNFRAYNLGYERSFKGVRNHQVVKMAPYFSFLNGHVIDLDVGDIKPDQIPISVLQLTQLQNLANSGNARKPPHHRRPYEIEEIDYEEDTYEDEDEPYERRHSSKTSRSDDEEENGMDDDSEIDSEDNSDRFSDVETLNRANDEPVNPAYQRYLMQYSHLEIIKPPQILQQWKQAINWTSKSDLLTLLKRKVLYANYTLEKITSLVTENRHIEVPLKDHPDITVLLDPLKKLCKKIKNSESKALHAQLNFDLYDGIPIAKGDLQFLKDFHELNAFRLEAFQSENIPVKDAMIIINDLRIKLLRVVNHPNLQLPSSIANLDQLNVLDLQSNQLTTLPTSLEQLVSLKRADFQRNLFTHIPSWYWKFGEQAFLYGFYGNPVIKQYCIQNISAKSFMETSKLEDAYPKWQLTDLYTRIQGNSPLLLVDMLHPELLRYKTEIEQYCQAHPTKVAHDCLIFLKERAAIDTISQTIHQLLPFLYEFPSYREGNFFGFQIHEQHVSALRLPNKGLEQVPEIIGDLPFLQLLDLNRNSLTSLPWELARLTKLDHLYLLENQITEFPFVLFELHDQHAPLHHREFDGNPFYENDAEIPYLEAFFEGNHSALLKRKYKKWTFLVLERKIKENLPLTQLDLYYPHLAKFAGKIEELSVQYPTATAKALVQWIQKISRVSIDHDHNIML